MNRREHPDRGPAGTTGLLAATLAASAALIVPDRLDGEEAQDPDEAEERRAAVVEAARLHGARFSFSEVVEAATGRRVLPLRPDAEAPDRAIAEAVAAAAARVLERLNRAESPVRGLRRINEASRFFEDALRAELDAAPGFACRPPESGDGRLRRAGYPDLELVHRPSGRIAYLDPKLFESGSRDSSLRTFYYQPDAAGGGKVRRDAHHLLVGFEHDGREGAWTFLHWHLVDLAALEVRLKSEFQASNRELYEDASIVRSGGRPALPDDGRDDAETPTTEAPDAPGDEGDT